MKRVIALSLVAIFVFVCISGCSPQKTPAATEPAKTDRQMVVAIPGLPDTGDCQNTSSLYVRLGMNHQVYDTLMAKDSDGKIVNNMVESYEMTPDASLCTVKLVKGIKWWDGTELTSEDVKFTIERAKTAKGSQKSACADIDRIEVIDDYNFKIVMATPNVALMEYLTYIFIMNRDFVTKCGDKYGTSVDTIMGSGPYVIKEWEFGDHIVYEAFKDYFKGEPSVKSVLLKVISDSNAAVIALQTGEIDLYMNDVPNISLATIAGDNKLALDSFSSLRYNYILFNSESGTFADVIMRQAVAYGINREDMLIIACEDVNNGFIINSPAGPDFNANPGYESWPYGQDIEKAAKLVKEAGCEGKKVVIKTLSVEPYIKLATKLQDSLSKIGLTTEIVQLENSAYINDVCGNTDFEIAICFNSFSGKDMDIPMNAQLHSSKAGMSGNYGKYSNATMDDLILKAKVETDPAKRTEIYKQAVDLFGRELPSIPLYYAKSTRAYSADLKVVKNCAQYDKIYYYSWAK